MKNKITISCRIGRTPRLTSLPEGLQVAQFTAAICAESIDDIVWFNVEAWGDIAQQVMESLVRGSRVTLTGRIAIETYVRIDKYGELMETNRPVLKLTKFAFLDRRPPAIQCEQEARRLCRHINRACKRLAGCV